MAHTPGPWEAFPSNFWTIEGEPTPAEGIWHIATPVTPHPRPPGGVVRTFVGLAPFYGAEAEANARLIAAAPEQHEGHLKISKIANLAFQMGDAECRRALQEIYEISRAAIAKALKEPNP